jgi:hypothetical protein
VLSSNLKIMKETNSKMNNKYLRFEVSESGGEISHGDAAVMRARCDAWLRKRDPFFREPGSFSFGSLQQRKKAA